MGPKDVCGAPEPVNQAAGQQQQTARAAHADQSPRTPGGSPSAAEPIPHGPSLAEPAVSPDGSLRIWIDEFFFAEGETVLLREAVAAAGASVAVLAGETRNRVLQLKSYQQAAKADVLWTGRLVRARERGQARVGSNLRHVWAAAATCRLCLSSQCRGLPSLPLLLSEPPSSGRSCACLA